MSHTPVSFEEVKKQLRAVGASYSHVSQAEVKQLPKIMLAGEVIEAYLIGFYEGGYAMLVATNKRLLFLDVMPFGRMIIDDMPYTMVVSIELQVGLFFSSVKIFCRPKEYRFWWVNKQNASTFHTYIEKMLLEYQKKPEDQK